MNIDRKRFCDDEQNKKVKRQKLEKEHDRDEKMKNRLNERFVSVEI